MLISEALLRYQMLSLAADVSKQVCPDEDLIRISMIEELKASPMTREAAGVAGLMGGVGGLLKKYFLPAAGLGAAIVAGPWLARWMKKMKNKSLPDPNSPNYMDSEAPEPLQYLNQHGPRGTYKFEGEDNPERSAEIPPWYYVPEVTSTPQYQEWRQEEYKNALKAAGFPSSITTTPGQYGQFNQEIRKLKPSPSILPKSPQPDPLSDFEKHMIANPRKSGRKLRKMVTAQAAALSPETYTTPSNYSASHPWLQKGNVQNEAALASQIGGAMVPTNLQQAFVGAPGSASQRALSITPGRNYWEGQLNRVWALMPMGQKAAAHDMNIKVSEIFTYLTRGTTTPLAAAQALDSVRQMYAYTLPANFVNQAINNMASRYNVSVPTTNYQQLQPLQAYNYQQQRPYNYVESTLNQMKATPQYQNWMAFNQATF